MILKTGADGAGPGAGDEGGPLRPLLRAPPRPRDPLPRLLPRSPGARIVIVIMIMIMIIIIIAIIIIIIIMTQQLPTSSVASPIRRDIFIVIAILSYIIPYCIILYNNKES